MASTSSENSTYAKFDESIRRSIRIGDVKAISKLKIADLSKYIDKRFKAIKILQGSTQSPTHCKVDETDAKDNGWHNFKSGNLKSSCRNLTKKRRLTLSTIATTKMMIEVVYSDSRLLITTAANFLVASYTERLVPAVHVQVKF